MFFVTSIGFLYTYNCNFKCRYCSIGSGPQHNSVLPINYVDKAIREASEVDEEEEVKHICHACHLLATKYWKELETRGKEWIINDLKKEVKGLNVRVLAK